MAWMKQSGRVWMPGLGGISRLAAALGGEPGVEGVDDFSHGHAETLDVGLAQVDELHRTPPASRLAWGSGRPATAPTIHRPASNARVCVGCRAALHSCHARMPSWSDLRGLHRVVKPVHQLDELSRRAGIRKQSEGHGWTLVDALIREVDVLHFVNQL